MYRPILSACAAALLAACGGGGGGSTGGGQTSSLSRPPVVNVSREQVQALTNAQPPTESLQAIYSRAASARPRIDRLDVSAAHSEGQHLPDHARRAWSRCAGTSCTWLVRVPGMAFGERAVATVTAAELTVAVGSTPDPISHEAWHHPRPRRNQQPRSPALRRMAEPQRICAGYCHWLRAGAARAVFAVRCLCRRGRRPHRLTAVRFGDLARLDGGHAYSGAGSLPNAARRRHADLHGRKRRAPGRRFRPHCEYQSATRPYGPADSLLRHPGFSAGDLPLDIQRHYPRRDLRPRTYRDCRGVREVRDYRRVRRQTVAGQNHEALPPKERRVA